jgi:hypothetical protein
VTQSDGKKPANIRGTIDTRLAIAMVRPEPNRRASGAAMNDPSSAPKAPVNRKAPNHASGNPSRSTRNSTNEAVAAEKHRPMKVLRNNSFTSIRLPKMKRNPSASARCQGSRCAGLATAN